MPFIAMYIQAKTTDCLVAFGRLKRTEETIMLTQGTPSELFLKYVFYLCICPVRMTHTVFMPLDTSVCGTHVS